MAAAPRGGSSGTAAVEENASKWAWQARRAPRIDKPKECPVPKLDVGSSNLLTRFTQHVLRPTVGLTRDHRGAAVTQV